MITPVCMTVAEAINPAYYIAPVAAVVALVMAYMFSVSVMKKSEGTPDMVRIAEAVRDGAMAYLMRQYKVVAAVFVEDRRTHACRSESSVEMARASKARFVASRSSVKKRA